jgi:hypothetical protein
MTTRVTFRVHDAIARVMATLLGGPNTSELFLTVEPTNQLRSFWFSRVADRRIV